MDELDVSPSNATPTAKIHVTEISSGRSKKETPIILPVLPMLNPTKTDNAKNDKKQRRDSSAAIQITVSTASTPTITTPTTVSHAITPSNREKPREPDSVSKEHSKHNQTVTPTVHHKYDKAKYAAKQDRSEKERRKDEDRKRQEKRKESLKQEKLKKHSKMGQVKQSYCKSFAYHISSRHQIQKKIDLFGPDQRRSFWRILIALLNLTSTQIFTKNWYKYSMR